MAVLENFGRFFPANLLAGTLLVLLQLKLANIKQSQNLGLIRKTKEKEEKQLNIFENLKKANSSKLKVESIPKEGAAQ
jgi:hypothetical protein